MDNETLDNILENQDKKITETNQLLENVLESNDDNAKKLQKKTEEGNEKVSEVIKELKLDFAGIETIKGKDGENGANGEKGDVGSKGERGENGYNGKDGKNGLDGKSGEDGKIGNNGLDGSDGKNGADGKSGKDGKNADIKEIIKILEKRKISYKDLKDVPTLYKKGAGGGTGYLREITDIEILEAPTDGQSLVYDASKKQWIPSTVSGGSGTVENLSAQCNGSDTVITTASNNGIIWLVLNGTMLIEGKEFTRDSATQIILTFAPETGEELYLKYV